MRLLILFLVLIPKLIYAGAVYKSLDASGKTIYSDQPPRAEKIQKTLNFADLPSSSIPETGTHSQPGLQKDAQTKPQTAGNAIGKDQPTLFSASWCGYCRKAKAYLAEKNIHYKEYDVDTGEGKQALQEIGGSRSIPVLLRNGQKIQGFSREAYDAVFN